MISGVLYLKELSCVWWEGRWPFAPPFCIRHWSLDEVMKLIVPSASWPLTFDSSRTMHWAFTFVLNWCWHVVAAAEFQSRQVICNCILWPLWFPASSKRQNYGRNLSRAKDVWLRSLRPILRTAGWDKRRTGVEDKTTKWRAAMLDICRRVDVVVDRSPEVWQEDTVDGARRQLVRGTGTQLGHRRQLVPQRPWYKTSWRRRHWELFTRWRTLPPVRYTHTTRARVKQMMLIKRTTTTIYVKWVNL